MGPYDRAVVEFADTLVGQFDLPDFLRRLCRRCTQLFAVDSVGVALAWPGDALSGLSVTDAFAEHLEETQLSTLDGPGIDAYHSGMVVVEPDMPASGSTRWPRFGPVAVSAGVAAAASLPMQWREHRLGTLNMYYVTGGPLTLERVRRARTLAQIATIGILQELRYEDTLKLARQLQHALDSRVVIEQAKGVLVARDRLSAHEAFTRLRADARSTGRRLRELADEIVRTATNGAHVDASQDVEVGRSSGGIR
jgi:GAF domain-containing protein